MAKRGNIKYQDWLTKDSLLRLESWASDGLTNEDIASNIGIARQTLSRWCREHSSISDAINKGRAPVVREIENAIVKKAKGFEYEETTTEIWVDDDGNKRQKVTKHKRYSAPDTGAAIFLLKNYKPNKYRNYNDLTKKQIEMDIKRAQAEIDKIDFDIQATSSQEDKLMEYFDKLERALDYE